MSKLLLSIIISLVFVCGYPKIVSSESHPTDDIPTRYGLASVVGNSFDPVTDIFFVQISGFIMWDYEDFWHHWAPEPLRFKIEGNIGATTSPQIRGMVSIEMVALYYLDFISKPWLKPFVELGIGLAYTDFQVEGQGSRFNFNPQIGIGTEFKHDSGVVFFATMRLSHISNAGFNSENRGVNFVILKIGRFF